MALNVRIPDHLSELPVRRGFPVPYVAEWTDEAVTYIEYEPELGLPVVKTRGRQGVGQPVFGKMNPTRQRECVMRRHCQVCHHHLESHGWFVVHWVSKDPLGPLVPDEPIIDEPPLCAPCARFSLEVCPGLTRDIQVGSGMLVYFASSWDWAMPMVLDEGTHNSVAVYVYSKLKEFETITKDQFMELSDT